MQEKILFRGAACGAALFAALIACSGHGGSPVPAVEQAQAPNPASTATPPVTAPVTIPYPYTNNWTTTTWAGPTASPSSTTGSDDGVTTVKFALDKTTGVYDVFEGIKSKLGYIENLYSAIAFAAYGHRTGIDQIILSDNYTYTDGPFSETGTDTYPKGQNSFDFPLTTGNRWSAAAGHTSYYNEYQSGSGAFEENVAWTEAADGSYEGQTAFSSLGGSKIQDDYASTTQVLLYKPSVYTLSERAAGYNKLTQTFELPSAGNIAVRSTGHEPLPFKRGTVNVPDWYPGHGPLPDTLYYDRFHVVGTATMPSSCGHWSGKSSSEVTERYLDLDPVQGFRNTYVATYYLTQLAKGQFWFACIIEKYQNDSYANGWAMSAGHWGGLSSQQIGTEILIAKPLRKASRTVSPALAALPALPFPSLGFRVQGRR
jgi:hypothetical protein